VREIFPQFATLISLSIFLLFALQHHTQSSVQVFENDEFKLFASQRLRKDYLLNARAAGVEPKGKMSTKTKLNESF
jgi:hypothetical protein